MRRTATTRPMPRCASRARAGRLRVRSPRSSSSSRRPLPDVDRAEIAGPGFVNLWLAGVVRRRARRDPRGGNGLRRRLAAPKERVQVEMVSANPTGPIVVSAARNGALRRLGRAAARVRGRRGRARVLLQRCRRADGPLPRLGRGTRRGEEPPEDGYQGDVRRRAGEDARRPGAGDAAADRGRR